MAQAVILTRISYFVTGCYFGSVTKSLCRKLGTAFGGDGLK